MTKKVTPAVKKWRGTENEDHETGPMANQQQQREREPFMQRMQQQRGEGGRRPDKAQV